MSDLDALESRIDELVARAQNGEARPEVVRGMEDVLAQGYAEALRLDASRRRLDCEMEELAESPTDAGAAHRLRRLAVEARTVEQCARELRLHLGVLRERFVALGGTEIG